MQHPSTPTVESEPNTKRDSKFQDVSTVTAFFETMNTTTDPISPPQIPAPILSRQNTDKMPDSTTTDVPSVPITWPPPSTGAGLADVRSISTAAELASAAGDGDEYPPPADHPPVPARKQSRGLSMARLTELMEGVKGEGVVVQGLSEEGRADLAVGDVVESAHAGGDAKDPRVCGALDGGIVQDVDLEEVQSDSVNHPEQPSVKGEDEEHQHEASEPTAAKQLNWVTSPLHSPPIISVSPPSTQPTPETTVNMSFMKLAAIPMLLTSPDHIMELNLSHNDITTIPPGFFDQLPNLQVLDLSRNMLEDVPGAIVCSKEITHLLVGENRLTKLPSEIASMEKMVVLDVHKNGIEELDDRLFENMTQLTTLDLSHNKLTNLPSSLGLLQSTLRAVDLDGNAFRSPLSSIVSHLICAYNFLKASTSSTQQPVQPSRCFSLPIDQFKQDHPFTSPTPPTQPASRSHSLRSFGRRRPQSLPAQGLGPEQMAELNAMLGKRKEHSRPPILDGRREPRNLYNAPASSAAASNATLPELVDGRSSRDSSMRPNSGGDEGDGHGFVEPQIVSGTSSIGRGSRMMKAMARKISRNLDEELPPKVPSNQRSRSSSPNPSDKKFSSTPELSQTDPTTRRRPFSLFANRASAPNLNSPLEDQTKTAEQVSYICLLRVLNYLHDLYNLDPRLNAANIDVIRAGADQDASDDELSESGDIPEARAFYAKEILTTERTYVEQMQALVDVYVDPIEEGEVLSLQDVNLVFSNARNILMFHKDHLLPALEKALEEPPHLIGAAFLKIIPFLKMYSIYFNQHHDATKYVQDLTDLATSSATFSRRSTISSTQAPSSPTTPNASRTAATKAVAKRFHTFMKQAKQNPRHTQDTIQSFLILPVQRLPRYKLLMDPLLKATPPTHPDYPDLKKAREEIKKILAVCNEKMKEWAFRQSGLEVLKKVKLVKWSVGGDTLRHVRPGRCFVREGCLRVVKTVEFLGSSAGSPLIDAVAACGGKKDRCKRSIVGHLIETRLGGKGESLEPVQVASSLAATKGGNPFDVENVGGACAVYGLSKSTGRPFYFFLFTDLLCWCRVPAEGEAEFELVRAFRIHPGTRVECRVVESEGGKGKGRNVVRHSVLRVGDEECILYLRGPTDEIEDWVSSFEHKSVPDKPNTEA
ncbi:hypothetical protein HK097_009458 [Rhizophlyctis rosea]|uniref:DH domain-containing protein n=1 Tax=Rhizophlyctis rosea TaxID=64517 RepID=A0AAD5X380_9FUNG|nr:hypothetical protein HK097_009458 [Rhizophlyctis rosea]